MPYAFKFIPLTAQVTAVSGTASNALSRANEAYDMAFDASATARVTLRKPGLWGF